ncbi:MAG: hypothetical protein JJ971_07460 [Balneolaceae bacterium]|nr:hypothetical protein [Balneolaceae bacterium]MBO6546929.1 hypothetical protein [Balneolaceae bacterium]MBO6649289.1 hypothetical protein [Balneolaceae bacterium]
MKIIFFEIDAINVKRYYLDVLKEVINSNEISILIENEEEERKLKAFGYEFRIECLEKLKGNDIDTLIKNHDVFIINGQRIPDIYLTQISNSYGIHTVYIQHGLYIPLMKRNAFFFISKLKKTLRYLNYAIRSSILDSNILLFFRFFLTHTLIEKREYNFKKTIGFPNRAIVISKYWEEWHKTYYFNEDFSRFTICGNPELIRYQNSELGDDSIVYCYQTLVEDGRLSKEKMYEILENLITWSVLKKKELVVKGHPRMGHEAIAFFKDHNVKIFRDSIPIAPIVIGHYSSLLPAWAYFGCKVYSLKLEGHNIQESIVKTTQVINHLDEIDSKPYKESKYSDIKEEVSYYFNYTKDYGENVNKIIIELEKS